MSKLSSGSITNRPSANPPGNPGQPPMPKRPHQSIVVMVSDVDNRPEKTMTKKIAKAPAKQGSKVAKKLAAKSAVKKAATKKTALKKVLTKTSAGLTESQVNDTLRSGKVVDASPAQRKTFNDALPTAPSTISVQVKDGKFKAAPGSVHAKLAESLKQTGTENAKKIGRGLNAPIIHIDAAGFLPAKPKALVSKHVQIDFSKGKQLVGRTLAQATRGLKAYVVATHAASKTDYVFGFTALSDKPANVKRALRNALNERGYSVKAITA